MFPLGFMLYFGDPNWYENMCCQYVLRPDTQSRGRFMPPETDFVRGHRHSHRNNHTRKKNYSSYYKKSASKPPWPTTRRLSGWCLTSKRWIRSA